MKNCYMFNIKFDVTVSSDMINVLKYNICAFEVDDEN